MIKVQFFALLFFLSSMSTFGQCLTDFEKKVPDVGLDYSEGFGYRTSIWQDIMAVSAPTSDSLGRITGIVYLYQNVDQKWINIGILKPSQPLEGLVFGQTVKVAQDYIFVGARYGKGRVYVFKKPTDGWKTLTESTILEEPDTQRFGASYRLSNIEISDDQQTLIISDEGYLNSKGAVFVYHKQPFEEWSKTSLAQVIINPDNTSVDLGAGGLAINGNHIAIGTPYGASGDGIIYVFKTTNGLFNDLQLTARLTVVDPTVTSTLFGLFTPLIFTSEGIFSSAVTSLGNRIAYFEKPQMGWANATQTCMLNPTAGLSVNIDFRQGPLKLSYSEGRLYAAFQTESLKGYVVSYSQNNQDWCSPTSEIIYETSLTSFSSFARTNSAGKDVLCIGLVGIPDKLKSEVALLSLHKSSSIWTTETIFNFRKTNAGYFMGISLFSMDSTLFVGASKDSDAEAGAGAIYIYKQISGNWKKTGKILPNIQKKGEGGFGISINGNGNYLAVGATGFGNGGKIFIYKKNGTDWSVPQLTKTLDAPPNVNARYFGQSIAISDKWLVVSFQRSETSQGDKNYIYVYKRNGEDWILFQTIVPGGISFFARSNVYPVALEDETFVVGNTYNSAYVYQFNTISNTWASIAELSPSDPEFFQVTPDFQSVVTNGSLFGLSVHIKDNTIFVGAPIQDFGSIKDVGAVYVYVKEDRDNWTSRTETAKLLPKNKVSRDLFGSSISSLENTVVIGAYGSDYNYDNTGRSLPGKSHVIQALDYNWRNTIELLTLTGDTFKKDYFGFSQLLDYNHFFIGSPIEDTPRGGLSGSVYITKAPPIVKLQKPICANSEPTDLFGYPFGGVWSGVGISNATKGTFDPKLAGLGLHELTYQTPNCFYTGRLLIEVVPPPKAILISSEEQIICSAGKTSVTLAAEYEPNVTCRWYYRKDEFSNFQQYGLPSFSITVNNPGEYKAQFSNSACSVEKSILVKTENIQITINVPPVCDPDISTVILSAQPSGGTWSGTSINGNTWNVKNLSDGSYPLTYRYSSPNSCTYSITKNIEIKRLPSASIVRLGGGLCTTGFVTLGIQSQNSTLSFNWFRQSSSGDLLLIPEANLSTLRTTENGTYIIEIGNDLCKKFLLPFVLEDKFSVDIEPNDNYAKTCSLTPFYIKTQLVTGDQYAWFFGTDTNSLDQIEGQSDNALEIKKTGNYQLEIQRGLCLFKSEIKFIDYAESEKIYAANVFTPNGDGHNDTFSIESTFEQTDVKIFNRYGKQVFSGKSTDEWKGEDISTGVYFWFASYMNCLGQKETVKGIVQLLR